MHVYYILSLSFLFFVSEDLDFTGNMWEILFSSSPSSTSSSSFTIPIISDSIPEETELFGLKIVLADSIVNRTTVGEPSITTVIIQGMLSCTYLRMHVL